MSNAPERRELKFDSLSEVAAEVERLASCDKVSTTGNHSFAKILNHLALSQDVSSGRSAPPPAPFYMKLMMPLMRWMVINDKPVKPGVKLPAAAESFFWPEGEIEISEALQSFSDSMAHYQSKGPIEKHPFFGRLTREESDQLNCRHAALHLSFVHPG
jgi:hypothetical protein